MVHQIEEEKIFEEFGEDIITKLKKTISWEGVRKLSPPPVLQKSMSNILSSKIILEQDSNKEKCCMFYWIWKRKNTN
jgi:hypothetical protein